MTKRPIVPEGCLRVHAPARLQLLSNEARAVGSYQCLCAQGFFIRSKGFFIGAAHLCFLLHSLKGLLGAVVVIDLGEGQGGGWVEECVCGGRSVALVVDQEGAGWREGTRRSGGKGRISGDEERIGS
eukprot:5690958-Pleurochrysis_carterae.AAC.1